MLLVNANFSFHSALCHIPQSKPDSPYIGEECRYHCELNWGMGRGLLFTRWGKPLVCHRHHTFILSSHNYPRFPGALSPGSCLHPSKVESYLPSISLLHPELLNNNNNLGQPNMTSQLFPKRAPEAFRSFQHTSSLIFGLLLMLLVSVSFP